MIKEILKGNNIPLKSENQSKKKTDSMKGNTKRINSVLNDFISFRKINFKKKNIKPYLFEKTNSVKIFISTKKKNNSYKEINNKKKNNSLTNSSISIERNNRNKARKNTKENNTYTIKKKKDISTELSNLNSVNFEKSILLEKTINKVEKISDKYLKNHFNINLNNKKFDEEENQNVNGSINKKIYLRNLKFDNQMFISNLEQEFEIRFLKKKIKKLKNTNLSLKVKLDNIMEKNYLLESDTLKEQKKRKQIINSSIDMFKNNINNKDEYEEEYNFKNLLLNLMDLKYNYENIYLNNNFLSSIEQLFILSNIFNDNDNKNNNDCNNIYYNIKNLIRLKTKYINDIKQYNILKIENKKYYNYLLSLGKNLNINNLEELEKFLKNIKSSNDNEMRKIIKMKNVLFDDNKSNKRKNNINSSVDNVKNNRKSGINYNYADLQKYFIENNNRYYYRNNNNSAKVSNIDIRGGKKNAIFGCLTEKTNHRFFLNDRNDDIGNKTCKNENTNYYAKKRGKIITTKFNSIGNNLKKVKRIKSNINKENDNNNDNDNDNDNNLLYFSYKNKMKNIPPSNNRPIKKLELKKINNEIYVSTNNLTCYNDNKFERKNNRINYYKIDPINNKLNNSTDIKFIGIPDNINEKLKQKGKIGNNQLYDKQKNKRTNNYISNINIKKKTFKLKNGSLKTVKNYGTMHINK